MKNLKVCLCSTLLVIVSDSPSELGRAASSPRPIACTLKRLPPARHHAIPHIPLREGTSLNWSGYQVVDGSLGSPASGVVTEVAGCWTVPTVMGAGDRYSSLWVGIDGYADGTVEQIGTEEDLVVGPHHRFSQQNYAWFEMYPADFYEIVGFPIHVGDVISAGVTYEGGDSFILGITNETRDFYYIVPRFHTMSSMAERSSAEWIVEAPSTTTEVLPLAYFWRVTFNRCSATITEKSGPISDWTDDPLKMETPSGVVKAVPSRLSNGGSSFTVTWKHY
jgi:hypothetical protein